MGHFSAIPNRFDREDLDGKGHSFSRSYGANLPSSFSTVLSSTLGYSPRPPVLVFSTDIQWTHYGDFLGSVVTVISITRRLTSSSRLGVNGATGLPATPSYALERTLPSVR